MRRRELLIGLRRPHRRPAAVRLRALVHQQLAPHEVETLEEGDIVVLLGVPELLAAAEMRLLQG